MSCCANCDTEEACADWWHGDEDDDQEDYTLAAQVPKGCVCSKRVGLARSVPCKACADAAARLPGQEFSV